MEVYLNEVLWYDAAKHFKWSCHAPGTWRARETTRQNVADYKAQLALLVANIRAGLFNAYYLPLQL
jgi:hypothetical protein